MIEMFVVLTSGLAGTLIMAAGCAGISRAEALTFIRETLLPLSYKEFWLPRCPFCWVVRGFAILLLLLLAAPAAFAVECPQGMPGCKVVFVSPEMEQAFSGPNMIGDHATWANRAGMAQIVDLWKKAIADAPRGEMKKFEPPKPQSLESKPLEKVAPPTSENKIIDPAK